MAESEQKHLPQKLSDAADAEERHNILMGAIARGWCHETNSEKVMDADLCEAICEEIEGIL